MTPVPSSNHQDQLSMLASLTTKSMPQQEKTLKRPAPITIPAASKKRRGLVSRTHSPKSQVSPTSTPFLGVKTPAQAPQSKCEVRKLAPTVKGVTEAAKLICNYETVVVPTETVYMTCTSIASLGDPSKRFLNSFASVPGMRTISSSPEMTPILMVQRPVASLERMLSFPQKPYAIQEKDGKASPPVVFSEQKEVFRRIAKKFCPGPIVIYLNAKDGWPSVPLHSIDGVKYVGVSNSSHPLTNRLLKEVASEDRVVVAMPTFRNHATPIKYMTNAHDVCVHYSSSQSNLNTAAATAPTNNKKQTIHVLNGEDKRELFSVPTCHYGEPYKYSLWINDSIRTVFIRGAPRDASDNTTKATVVQAMLLAATTTVMTSSSSSNNNMNNINNNGQGVSRDDENDDVRLKNRNRVMTAVMRQWKVVDQRTTTTTIASSRTNG